LHIGPCCDFWADDGMCVCNPVDAAEYPRAQRLYAAGNISGFSSPNIRTIFPDGHDDVCTFNRGDYCWLYWDWGETVGTVKFELRDGSTVKATRSTHIFPPPPPPSPKVVYIAEIQFPRTAVPGTAVPIRMKVNAGNVESLWYTAEHVTPDQLKCVFFSDNPKFGYWALTSLIVIKGETIGDLNAAPYPNLLCRNRKNVARDNVSPPFNTGQYAHPTSLWLTCSFIMPENPVSGTIILATIRDEGGHHWPHSPGYHYMDKRAFSVGVKPCNEGEKRNPETCWDGSVIHKEVCKNNTWVPSGETCPPEPAAGEKRSPKTCWDGSVIHAEKYDAALHRWVPSGETCPVMPAHGTKRNPTTCWDGSIIYAEKFDATLKQWVPTGETPPPKPECTEGDKKAGYVCVAGKWQPAPAVPEPVVPPVEPPVTPPAAPPEYLTPEEAAERIRAGLPCYIKCTLPILDMLPGIPYTRGAWVPPFCEITTEP